MRKSLDLIRANCELLGQCWVWQASVNSAGYPQAAFDGKGGGRMVRQAVMELLGRDKPKAAFVLSSRCGDKRCCSPDCLRWTTRHVVQRQVWQFNQRSRALRAVGSARAAQAREVVKLTADKVAAIRRMVGDGASNQLIARELGVHPKRVSDIKRGRAHVRADPFAAIVGALR